MTQRENDNSGFRVMAIIEDADRPTVATLCGLQQRGCEVSVISLLDSPARSRLEAAGVRLMPFEIRRRFERDGIRRLRAELKAQRYDILHAYNNRGLQNGVIAMRGLPTRLVVYRGRVGNVSFLDPFSWLRHLNPRIDRLICVSDAVRDFFLNMRPAFLRGRPEKFVRIYKGHDLDWYRDAPADLTTFGIPADAFIVASIATYRPHKGIDHLVQAMALLPADWPIHLLLVGNMDDPRLDRLVNALPAPERVHRIGHRRDAPAFAAACDVFALPTIIPEGLPRSVIEAMAYERPCVVTTLGGQAELVEDGVSGLQVQPENARAIADAITRLYQDPELRRSLGRNARERIRNKFNIEQTIDATLDVYRSIRAEQRT